MTNRARRPVLLLVTIGALCCARGHASADTAVPPARPLLQSGLINDNSIEVRWVAVGSDGQTGTVAAHELRYAKACPLDEGSFANATLVALGAPRPAGSAESVVVGGLEAHTGYCFMLKVSDSSSSVYSASLSAHTPWITAPATVQDLAVEGVSSRTLLGNVTLHWTAPGDFTASAQSYDLRYNTCPLDSASFSSAARVRLPAPHSGTTIETATVTGLPQKTAYCFALTTTDAAGVTSEISNVVQATVPDGEAPAAPVLSGTQVSADSVELDWVAVGDDGTTGAATTYELRYGFRQPYDDCVHLCPLTAEMFSRAFVIEGLPAPQQAGQHESFIARGLQQGTLVVDYCFALKVTDEAGNSTLSPSAQVTNAYR